ncbi:hypothetical protein RGN35_002082 [Acinetobacter baumannii]|nr:hypothetical protein [Acinetobacter baumannii]
MTDLNKEREAFERLPLAELAIKSEYVYYNEETNSYWPNEDFCPSDAPETMNFAWAAWQEKAKAQAVPEGYVLLPRVPTEKFKEDLKQHLDELWWGDHGCDWDGFVSVNGIDPLKIYALAIEASESGAEG